jgi:type IV pilus assembly protein PilA
MLSKLRRRVEDEKGFTLIELLVVILIIGILAAIAIPAFLNQRGKAYDASAKSQVKTAQTAAETYSTDHNGDWTGMDVAALTAIEPTLGATSGAPTLTVVSAGPTGYAVSSQAVHTNDTFTITVTNGNEVNTCTGTGGGCVGSSW